MNKFCILAAGCGTRNDNVSGLHKALLPLENKPVISHIIDRLGEPYISKNKQGMGLGIFIAKNLIENMGGNISLYNANDENAVVEITFDNSILNI